MNFANKISIFRVISVPFFIATALYYSPERDYLRWVSLGIFLIAAVSDAVDGYIARKRGEKTVVGAIIDPLADKLLLISAFICLRMVGGQFPGGIRFPLWFILIVISRDCIILVGSAVIYLLHGNLTVSPTKLGKAAVALQMLCIIGLLIQWRLSFILWDATVVFTVLSGFEYMKQGIIILNSNAHKTNPRAYR